MALLKEVSLIARTGVDRHMGEIKGHRCKFECQIRPAKRVTPSETIEVSLFLGTDTGLKQASALQSVHEIEVRALTTPGPSTCNKRYTLEKGKKQKAGCSTA